MTLSISELFRYPVKGLSGEALDFADLVPDGRIAHDRRFALAHASSGIDRLAPTWMPKNHFINLSRDEKAAQLGLVFDADATILTIERGGRQVAKGDPTTGIGRMTLDQFFAGFLPPGARGNPKLVDAGETAFADCPEPFLSLVNLASVADIERVARQPVNARRFRANLYLAGAERWEERDWIGREVQIGSVRLRFEEPIERCGATNVDPETAARDMNIPLVLERGFGHVECGVYARVIAAGRLSADDTLHFDR